MGNREAKPVPSLAGLVRKLKFLQHYWRDVGVSLQISQENLQEIDEDPWRRSEERKLERVIAKWIEENQCELLLHALTRALVNKDFVQQNNEVQQSLQRLMGKA